MAGRRIDEERLDRTYDPIKPVLDANNESPDGSGSVIQPSVACSRLAADIGRIPVYLLDTDVEANQPWIAPPRYRLYTNDSEQRLRQEIVLGIGGMRVLQGSAFSPLRFTSTKAILLFPSSSACACRSSGQKFRSLGGPRARNLHFHHPYPSLCGYGCFPFSTL